MVADYTPLVIENGRRIEFEPPSEPTIVRATDGRSNASSPICSTMRCAPSRTAASSRFACCRRRLVEVVDHGAGVPPADRDKIFEPFWRRDSKSNGTGLGLAISKTLVEQMGGSIGVDETSGGGATFRIALRKSVAQPSGSRGRVDVPRMEGSVGARRSGRMRRSAEEFDPRRQRSMSVEPLDGPWVCSVYVPSFVKCSVRK